jgi:hypothetical protein
VSGASRGAADLVLSCQPSRANDRLVFPYSITNRGSADVYVMDALGGVDASGAAKPNTQWVVVLAGPGSDATVARMIPPLPTDRRIAMPVIPLARRLRQGETLEGRIEIPEPLAETSPYFGDLPLRRYEVVAVGGVVLSVGYWSGGSNTLVAVPTDYAPDHVIVHTADPARSAHCVSVRLPAQGLQLFRRTDRFPRLAEATSPVPVSRPAAAVA